MTMIEPFIARALLAGTLAAAAAAALGCFVVWRRMAYFGDSIAHGALLGVALGAVIGISHTAAALVVCMIFAMFLAYWRRLFSLDVLMGVAAHASLAFGVLAISAGDENLDLHAYLLGDILFAGMADLGWLSVCAILVFGFLAWNWRALVLCAVNEDIAACEGVKVERINLSLLLLMAFVVAASVRVAGVLLVASLLIIPAATARQFAATPSGMAVIAVVLGVISVFVGVGASLYLDLPASPAIVAFASLLFAFSLFVRRQA